MSGASGEFPGSYRFEEGSIRSFVEQLGSRKSVPGGGSTCALVGALASALFLKAYCFSSSRFPTQTSFEDLQKKLKELQEQFIQLTNEDAQAYHNVIRTARQVFQSVQEKEKCYEKALAGAAAIPLQGMKTLRLLMHTVQPLESLVHPRLRSDYQVACFLVQSAFQGLVENVDINFKEMKDSPLRRKLENEKQSILLDRE